MQPKSNNRTNQTPFYKTKFIYPIILVAVAALTVIVLLVISIVSKPEHVAGEVKDGTVTYSTKINNINKTDSTQSIELKPIDVKYNSVTITNAILDKMKSGTSPYSNNDTVASILENNSLPNRDIYNITVAKDNNLLSDNNTTLEYYAIITGFKNPQEFIEFCEDGLGLVKNYQ
ncbi:hypothetical protein IJ096_00905 [Candidatus Saccharibacteria bacterium]|nr:hypothetical protein [Candidatus Saccharibacteria bacterium]